VQQRDELLRRGQQLLAFRGVHLEMGLRGKVEKAEQREREVGPALSAQSDKGKECQGARTDAKC
jgi:hypothetical protein